MQATQKKATMDESAQSEAKPKISKAFSSNVESSMVRQAQCPYQNVQALYRLQRTSSSMPNLFFRADQNPLNRARA